jgi:hypothetical protein
MRKRLPSEPSRLPLIYHAPESYVSGERIEAFGCLREPLLEEASSLRARAARISTAARLSAGSLSP